MLGFNLRFGFQVLAVLCTLGGLALGGCGGGGDDGERIEVLTINLPSSTGSYRTDQAYVTLQGTSFKPERIDGPTPVWQHCTLTEAYGVTAVDTVNGQAGAPVVGEAHWTGGGPNCDGLLTFWRFIDLPLARGENHITVTAREGNRVGSSQIVIERIADVTPPTVTSFWPESGATGVSRGIIIGAEFSEPMDAASFTTATFMVREAAGGAAVAGTVTYTLFMGRAEFTPATALAPSTTYAVEVSGARDASGVALAAPLRWTFTTGL